MADTTAPTDAQDREAGLLSSIVENPADDTARLVYADWLDEQGSELVQHCPGVDLYPCVDGWVYDGPGGGQRAMRECPTCLGTSTVRDGSNAARAEFIRVQCELGDTAPKDWTVSQMKAHRRSGQLLKQHGDRWRTGLPDAFRTHQFNDCKLPFVATIDRYTRGFPSHVSLPTAAFLDRHETRADVGECPQCLGCKLEAREGGAYSCRTCSGTGRVTRSDGFAARLVLAVPVMGITLQGREPYPFGSVGAPGPGDFRGEYTHYWVSTPDESQWNREGLRNRIPAFLRPYIGGHWVDLGPKASGFDLEGHYFSTPALAHAALSAAAVTLARTWAGLPPLPAGGPG